MQRLGADSSKSTEKLNNEAMSAEQKSCTGYTEPSLDERISALRARIGENKRLAAERAEKRIAELSYENAYRKKISMSFGDAAKKKIQKREEAQALETEKRVSEAKRAADEEVKRLEERMKAHDELIKLLKTKAEPTDNVNESLQSKQTLSAVSKPEKTASSAVKKPKSTAELVSKKRASDSKKSIGINISARPSCICLPFVYPYISPVFHSPVYDFFPSREGDFDRFSYFQNEKNSNERNASAYGNERRDVYSREGGLNERAKTVFVPIYRDLPKNKSAYAVSSTYAYPVEEPVITEPYPMDYPVEEPAMTEPYPMDYPVEEPAITEPYPMYYPVEEPVITEPYPMDYPAEEPVMTEPYPMDYPSEEPIMTEPYHMDYPAEEPVMTEPYPVDYPAEEPAMTEPYRYEPSADEVYGGKIDYPYNYGENPFEEYKGLSDFEAGAEPYPYESIDIGRSADIPEDNGFDGYGYTEPYHASEPELNGYEAFDNGIDGIHAGELLDPDALYPSEEGEASADAGHYHGAYERASDAAAMSAYDAMMATRMPEPKLYFDIEEPNADEPDLSLDFDAEEEYVPEFKALDEKALITYLKKSEKQVKAYTREAKHKDKLMKKLSAQETVRVLTDKININKHIVDERAEALGVICASGNKKYRRYHKRLLTSSIAEYNALISEYEAKTGSILRHASYSIPKDIIAGNGYKKLPLLRYSDEQEPYSVSEDGYEEYSPTPDGKALRDAMRREKLRLAKEAQDEENRRKKLARGKSLPNGSDTADGIRMLAKEKTERAVLMLTARFESEIASLEEKRDVALYSFSPDERKTRLQVKDINRRLRLLRKWQKAALKCEKHDSERYYAALAMTAESVYLKTRAKRERLDSLNMRIDTLLKERERINEQLIKLYTGSHGNAKIKKKARENTLKIRRKAIKRVNRRFRREMRVCEERIPLDIKEKLSRTVNGIMEAEASADALRYRMKLLRPKGSVKKQMKREIKEARASVKRYLSDYKHFMKKANRYVVNQRALKRQIVFIISTLLVVILAVILYFSFREPIHSFFTRLFGG